MQAEVAKIAATQKKEDQRKETAKVRNKMELVEKESKIRGQLLAALSEDDQERLKRNAAKRLGGK